MKLRPAPLMLALIAMLLVCVPQAASAAARSEPFRLIRSNEPAVLRPDRAYLLMRMTKPVYPGWVTAVFLKIPTTTELGEFEAAKQAAYAKAGKRAGSYEDFLFDYRGAPNLFAAAPKRAVATSDTQAIVVAEVPPGEYVFYGYGFGNFVSGCWCLGTVQFAADAGKLTDLGTLFMDRADKPSPFPELASETNLGSAAAMDYRMWSGAVRPARAADAVPSTWASAPRSFAKFRAVGPWVDPNVPLINRLAAMPGVLAYDEGRVIDVASGEEMKPR